MKNSFKRLVLILMAGALMGSSILPVMANDEKPKDRFENMVKELKLSPEQVEQFKKLKQENKYKETRKANQQKIMDLRKKIVDAYAQEPVDKAKVENYKKEIAVLMKEGVDQHEAHLAKLRGILTPEQFKKLHELREKHLKKMMKSDRDY